MYGTFNDGELKKGAFLLVAFELRFSGAICLRQNHAIKAICTLHFAPCLTKVAKMTFFHQLFLHIPI